MEKIREGKRIKRLAPLFLDALFPRRCPVCDQLTAGSSWSGSLICPECWEALSFIKSPVCKKCGKEIFSERAEYCLDCSRHRRSFQWGVGLLNYNEAAARSMAAIKYRNKREYLDFYGREAVTRCGGALLAMDADCLVPVPVHPKRYRVRGFNQAELLADRLGEALAIPVHRGLLFRSRNTEPQKSLNPSQRLANLEAAFQASQEEAAGMESVILVDDIYTTGSTVEACTRALQRVGVKKVYFFALCIGQGQ